jgi:hypothetical protein
MKDFLEEAVSILCPSLNSRNGQAAVDTQDSGGVRPDEDHQVDFQLPSKWIALQWLEPVKWHQLQVSYSIV